MGKMAREYRQKTIRTMRGERLTPAEKAFLLQEAKYKGHPHHKRNPGDFGLQPPAAPRRDKTLCDEAGIFQKSIAQELLEKAIRGGLVSEGSFVQSFPSYLWVVDDAGRVFEAKLGDHPPGLYHGYPIRRDDPLFTRVTHAWNRDE